MIVDVVIMTGGTGGHIFPGLAVADELQRQNYSVAWLGAHGLETRLVPEHGIELFSLSVKGLRGNGVKGWLSLPVNMYKAVTEAKTILRKLQPKCVIGFGGFASAPGAIAAKLLKIPIIIHEQNAAPGLTNRYLAKISQKVLTGFPILQLSKSQFVGNPVRAELFKQQEPNEKFKERNDEVLRLLVIGGSQGSRFINTIVPQIVKLSSRKIDVWHQTGEKLLEETEKKWAENGRIPYRIAPFVKDMSEAYSWADIIICRAGALTIAELSAVGLASVLVPLPSAVDDHQRKNAEYLVKNDAAFYVNEREYNAETVVQFMNGLTQNRLVLMANNARKNVMPNAVVDIVEVIKETININQQKE